MKNSKQNFTFSILFLATLSLLLAGCASKNPSGANNGEITAIKSTPLPIGPSNPTASPSSSVLIVSSPTATVTATSAPKLASVSTAISNCTRILESGKYYLNTDLEVEFDGFTCISIESQNVALDCKKHAITTKGINNTGILLQNADNTIVQNCEVNRFYADILIKNTKNATIKSNNLTGFYIAIGLQNSFDSKILFNTAYSFTSGESARLENSSHNQIAGNNFSKSKTNLYFENSDYNEIQNNTATEPLFTAAWLSHSKENIFTSNNFESNPLRTSSRAGIIMQNGDNTFKNNSLCTPSSFDIQCVNSQARDLGSNKCGDQDGCSMACTPC